MHGQKRELRVSRLPPIHRNRHVEPDDFGPWHAALSTVGGPVLGPIARRSQALAG
jgi:hypothetical protein